MEFRVLGPLDVVTGSTSVDLGTRKTRALLAGLLLRRNTAVSADALVDLSWPARLPANPRAALQTNIARVRRALGPAESARLETVREGYRLHVDDDELDAARFEQLVEQGRRAMADGSPGDAASRFRAALRLWRGPVLEDLDLSDDEAHREMNRLAELRIETTQDRIDAELALGRHRDLVPELETLAAAHPTREALWHRLAIALYRCNRQVDALDRCAELRLRLRDELGLEPSASHLELERRILDHDESLDVTIHEPVVASAPPAGVEAPLRLPRPLERVGATPMVGRRAEVEAAVRAVRISRDSRLVVVTGEQGIGKTRTVAEIAATLHRAGMPVVLGRCVPDPVLPYAPIVEILDQLLDTCGADLVEALGSHAGELGRLVPDLTVRFPSVGPPRDVDGGSIRYLLSRAVEQALSIGSSGMAITIVLDDLQWADPSTIAMLSALVFGDTDHPIHLLATRRPNGAGEVGQLLAEAGRRSALTEITLDGLSAEETSALVLHELESTASPWLGRTIHEHTGGNPFFALELARHVAERGGTTLQPDTGLPAGVIAVVTARIAELGSTARSVLEVASLIGSEFDPRIALDACPDPNAADGLEAATTSGLVTPVPGIGAQCAFSHAIVRSVLAQSIAPVRRQELHEAIARAVDRRHSDNPPHAMLAHHWSRAGTEHVDVAIEHATVAARESMRRRAYEDVEAHCRVALEAMHAAGKNDRRRLELLLLAADACDSMARRPRAQAHAQEAVALARVIDDADGLAHAALALVATLPDPTIAEIFEDALARVDDAHELRPLLLATLGWTLSEVDVERAERLVDAARSLPATASDVRALDRILSFDVYFGDGVHPATRVAAASEVLRQVGSDTPAQVAIDAHTYRGTAFMELGDFDRAERDFAAHARLSAEHGAPGGLAVDDQRRAMRALLRGHFEEAETRVHEAMLHVSDDPAWVGVYGAQLLAIRDLLGRYDEMEALLASLSADDARRPVARACRAMVHARLGRHDAAALLHELVEEAPSWRRNLFWTVAVTNLADAAITCADERAGRVLFDLLAPFEDRVAVFAFGAVCWGSVARFLAPLAVLLGDLDEGIRLYEKSIDTHTRLDAGPFLARDQVGLARALRSRGRPGDLDRSRQLAATSLATAGELGLSRLLEPASQLAAGAG